MHPGFTAALFPIAKTWKQLKCPLTDEWIFAAWLMELKLGLCDNLERWDGREVGGKFKREGT